MMPSVHSTVSFISETLHVLQITHPSCSLQWRASKIVGSNKMFPVTGYRDSGFLSPSGFQLYDCRPRIAAHHNISRVIAQSFVSVLSSSSSEVITPYTLSKMKEGSDGMQRPQKKMNFVERFWCFLGGNTALLFGRESASAMVWVLMALSGRFLVQIFKLGGVTPRGLLFASPYILQVRI